MKRKKEKSMETNHEENKQLLISLGFFLLGALAGMLSSKTNPKAAVIGGLATLYIMYVLVAKMGLVEKNELRANTIPPYLASWYASWVFFYNYFGVG